MKSKQGLFLTFALIFSMALFTGCGSSSSGNPNNNPPSQIGSGIPFILKTLKGVDVQKSLYSANVYSANVTTDWGNYSIIPYIGREYNDYVFGFNKYFYDQFTSANTPTT